MGEITMNTMTDDPPWPVLVGIKDDVQAAALMNHKAYRKSVESNIPWLVHPLTGRILPWPGKPTILSLVKAPGRFEMKLPSGTTTKPYGEASPESISSDIRSDRENTSDSSLNQGCNDVMERLSTLVAERRKAMPEGSYTTHLFAEGLEKIRKKTGEEAIELILARNEHDVIYEAADLSYHLLVLLEASNLSWREVLEALHRRHLG